MSDLESEILAQLNRRLVKNFLDVLILLELENSKRAMGGYDVIALVHKKFDIHLSPGTVYSCVYFLERNGLIKGDRFKRKKVYVLTEKGEETIKTILNLKNKILGLMVNLFM